MYVLMYMVVGVEDPTVFSVGAARLTTIRKWSSKHLPTINCVWRIFDCSDGTWVDSSSKSAWTSIQSPPTSIDLIVMQEGV